MNTNKNKGGARVLYTHLDDETIKEAVAQYPGAPKRAFKVAAKKIGRTVGGVSQRYYSHLTAAKMESPAIAAAGGNRAPAKAATGGRAMQIEVDIPLPQKTGGGLTRMEVAKIMIDKMTAAEKQDLLHYLVNE